MIKRLSTSQVRLNKFNKQMKEDEEDGENFEPSDDEPVSHRLSFGVRPPKKIKKKEAPKRLPPKPVQALTVNGKPAEFLEKAIVIHLKSVCREQ